MLSIIHSITTIIICQYLAEINLHTYIHTNLDDEVDYGLKCFRMARVCWYNPGHCVVALVVAFLLAEEDGEEAVDKAIEWPLKLWLPKRPFEDVQTWWCAALGNAVAANEPHYDVR